MESFIEKLEYKRYASSSDNYNDPIHNWFLYKHSFGRRLVSEIIKYLELSSKDYILDPFCGSGTTLLVSKHNKINSVGFDLMPLSVCISSAKSYHYKIESLINIAKKIKNEYANAKYYPKPDIAIIQKAYTQDAWNSIKHLENIIIEKTENSNRDFFLTGLISISHRFGRYSNDGGFPRLKDKPQSSPKSLLKAFCDKINKMIDDIKSNNPREFIPEVLLGDVRNFDHFNSRYFDAIICSPPYPNRHDYTRVYSVELATSFISNNKELKELRRKMFRSHIESKDDQKVNIIDHIKPFKDAMLKFCSLKKYDERVPIMLRAYFQDIELTLKNFLNLLKKNSFAVIVIGNVRYSGIMIPVDEIICLIAKELGFENIFNWIIRYRGNSPQQMKQFGREVMRESVLFLKMRD